MEFTSGDIKQIEALGLTLKKVNEQIELFKSGMPFVNLKEAATIDHGILRLPKTQQDHFINVFKNKRDAVSFVKFVPASGAATRMFKFLFKFLSNFNPETESLNAYINRQKDKNLSVFLVGLKDFPFYQTVKNQLITRYNNFDTLPKTEQFYLFVREMLDSDKLDFADCPKGLLPFHQYNTRIVTAFEEHLFEAASYASAKGQANLHFTISEQHHERFNKEFDTIKARVQQETNTIFNISYSYQQHATDTIAVTLDDKPFRQDDGTLLFRPSGHGALLGNLNQLDADIIFIKNIDNVVVNKYSREIGAYKMMLAGLLLELQDAVFERQKKLEEGNLSEADIHEIANFITQKLNVILNNDFEKYSANYQIDYLKDKIYRPIRICGMVKNEGEPGGGPFWVKSENGYTSLQIVESAQVDKKSKQQKELMKGATHFNPVDLVCGIKNYKGETYDLSEFVDNKTAFITKKTVQGQAIKALELPGLWNGSMAKWNTVFVEVPLITFNPVKTVNDLLKDTHQTQ